MKISWRIDRVKKKFISWHHLLGAITLAYFAGTSVIIMLFETNIWAQCHKTFYDLNYATICVTSFKIIVNSGATAVSILKFSMTLNLTFKKCGNLHNGTQYRCTERQLCWVSFMLSVASSSFMLNVVMLNVVMLNVVMLNVIYVECCKKTINA